MFSGKTTALINHCESHSKLETLICCKPVKDTRFGSSSIDSHAGHTFPAKSIDTIIDAIEIAQKYEHVVIDEVQFFDLGVEATISTILKQGKQVTLSGLEFDALHRKFGQWVNLFEKADVVIRKTGQCAVCSKPATHTFRKHYNSSVLQLGADESYEPRCQKCHQTGLNEQLELPIDNNLY